MTVTAFQQANQLLREGKLEEAIAAYRSAISQNPDLYLAHQNLGEALEKLGFWEDAVEAYQRAVDLKPKVAFSLWTLSRALQQVGRLEEAKKTGKQAVAIDPRLVKLNKSLEHWVKEKQQFQKKDPISTPNLPEKYHQEGETRQRRNKVEEIYVGFSDQYDVIAKGFDHVYYYRRYADIARGQLDPVKHYLEHGAREGRNPSPDFNTNYYRKRYPDVDKTGLNPFYHYLTIGKAQGHGTTHFTAGDPDFDAFCTNVLGQLPDEVSRELARRKQDLRRRLESGALGDMVARAGKIDPLIHHSYLAAMEAKFPPFHSESVVAQVLAISRLYQAAKYRRAKAVVVIPHCRLSGATRISGHLATALTYIYHADEEIVVIRTDLDIMEFPEWFPRNCRHVNFAGICQNVQPGDQEKLLAEFIRSLQPMATFNVNSRIFWDMMGSYGKALASDMAIYAYLFCNDKNIYGNWEGYPIRKFYRHFDSLSHIITDSFHLANELREQFLVPPNQAHRLVTLPTPITNPRDVVCGECKSKDQPRQIFWAGRFDRQKRVDIVFALANRLPKVKFHLWGEPVLDKVFHKLEIPNNVIIEGVYKDLSELPLEQCDLWLYTSEWDGVPNILIEIATIGIPIVGSLAGGTEEILLDGFCQRVSNVEDIDAFEVAIRETIDNQDVARERAKRLRSKMLAERTSIAYREKLEVILPVER